MTYFVIDSEGALPWVFSSFIPRLERDFEGVPKTLYCSSSLLSAEVVLLDTKADDCFSLAILLFVLVTVSVVLDDVLQVHAT